MKDNYLQSSGKWFLSQTVDRESQHKILSTGRKKVEYSGRIFVAKKSAERKCVPRNTCQFCCLKKMWHIHNRKTIYLGQFYVFY